MGNPIATAEARGRVAGLKEAAKLASTRAQMSRLLARFDSSNVANANANVLDGLAAELLALVKAEPERKSGHCFLTDQCHYDFCSCSCVDCRSSG
jgi:hypothetical protein